MWYMILLQSMQKKEKSFASYLLCSLYLLSEILYPYNSSYGLLSIYYELSTVKCFTRIIS